MWEFKLQYVVSYGIDKLKMEWILTLKLNLTLKVKVNHPQKQQVS